MTIFFEYFANLVDAVAGIWFITSYNKSSIKNNKLFFPFIILITIISNYFTHNTHFSEFHVLILTALLFTYSFSFKTSKLISKIFSPLIFMVVLIVVNTLLLLFIYPLLLPVELSDIVYKSIFHRYLYIFSCKIIMTSILLIINRFVVLNEHFSLLDLFVYMISPLVTILTLYLFLVIGIEYDISKYTAVIILIIFILSIINLTTLILFKKAVQNNSAKYELEMLNNRNEWEEQKYKDLETIHQRLQITRHDIKNHLLCINALINAKKYDEANDYIVIKQKELDESKQFFHTNNRLMDYIIDTKLSRFDDICFIVTGKLENIVGIDNFDLAALLGNILDNAISGTTNCDPKVIEIEFSYKNNYQSITCRNSIHTSVLQTNPDMKTTKNKKSNHGYGIKSIKHIVNKYNGLMEFYEKNNMFCIHIALPIKPLNNAK